MAINRVNGQMLESNLERDGVDIAFETDLLYIDVINGRIGLKNAIPLVDFHLSGTARIDGQLTVDNILTNTNTISATTGDLILDSTSGNVSFNNKRVINCADPVGALDVVNLQTLNSAVGGIAADQIISDNSSVTVIDDGISAGTVDFTIDGISIGTLSFTKLDMSTDFESNGNITSVSADLGDLNFNTDTVTSDTTDLNLQATTINLYGNVAIQATGANRIFYVNSSGIVDTKPALAFDHITDTMTITGTFIADSLTLDGTEILSATSLELTTTSDNDVTIATGAGEVNMTGTSAMGLPVGTTAQRPGAPTAGHMRWNTTTGGAEIYDGATWHTVQRAFNVTSQQIIPNGVDTDFTLNKSATTDGILVIVNGVVQDPEGGAIYSVSGTTLSFVDVLTAVDVVSVRFLEF